MATLAALKAKDIEPKTAAVAKTLDVSKTAVYGYLKTSAAYERDHGIVVERTQS